jgi:APA family basic amino acid/polyamine antiporter
MPDHMDLYRKATAAGIIIVFTTIHYFGLKSGSRVQNLLTMLKVSIIVILIIAGFAFGDGSFGHFGIEPGEMAENGKWKTIGLSLMWIMFAYSGWNAATYVGSEVLDPIKNIPRSLLTGTLVVAILYVLLNTLFVYAIPANEMKNVISIGGLAANNLFNRSIDQLFSAFIAVILLSAISSLIIIGPRVYYAMARSGHFFNIAGKTNKANVPGMAIILQSALALIFVFSGTFDQIITFLSISLGIFPILAVSGIFKLRLKQQSASRIPGYPVLQLIFIIFSIIILVLAYLERPVESSLAFGVVILGIPVYYLLRKNIPRKSP